MIYKKKYFLSIGILLSSIIITSTAYAGNKKCETVYKAVDFMYNDSIKNPPPRGFKGYSERLEKYKKAVKNMKPLVEKIRIKHQNNAKPGSCETEEKAFHKERAIVVDSRSYSY